MQLYHGTNPKNAKSILETGFETDCNSDYQNLGCGIYFYGSPDNERMEEYDRGAIVEATVPASVKVCDISEEGQIGFVPDDFRDWCSEQVDLDTEEECNQRFKDAFGEYIVDKNGMGYYSKYKEETVAMRDGMIADGCKAARSGDDFGNTEYVVYDPSVLKDVKIFRIDDPDPVL
jgi:hypothetical protein